MPKHRLRSCPVAVTVTDPALTWDCVALVQGWERGSEIFLACGRRSSSINAIPWGWSYPQQAELQYDIHIRCKLIVQKSNGSSNYK
jgi:hypothetical protein